jgi:hypothetical protein
MIAPVILQMQDYLFLLTDVSGRRYKSSSCKIILAKDKHGRRSMNNKIEALLQILAAIAIIYFGQQLLAQGRQNLLS